MTWQKKYVGNHHKRTCSCEHVQGELRRTSSANEFNTTPSILCNCTERVDLLTFNKFANALRVILLGESQYPSFIALSKTILCLGVSILVPVERVDFTRYGIASSRNNCTKLRLLSAEHSIVQSTHPSRTTNGD